jgi:acyl-CoA synthetase (AMP-forming)/AMP-acid ligase II
VLGMVAEMERRFILERKRAGIEIPFAQRQPARSVYELLTTVADRYPSKIAFRSPTKGLTDESVRDVTYSTFKRRIIQAANLFRSLRVGPNESVSLIMPIAADTFYAMFGAQVAGMANPINFLLETDHIVALLREARCRVLLGPDPDLLPEVWTEVEAVTSSRWQRTARRLGDRGGEVRWECSALELGQCCRKKIFGGSLSNIDSK